MTIRIQQQQRIVADSSDERLKEPFRIRAGTKSGLA